MRTPPRARPPAAPPRRRAGGGAALLLGLVGAAVALAPARAAAQLFPALPFDHKQFEFEVLNADHLRLVDTVEIHGDGFDIYADRADIYVERAGDGSGGDGASADGEDGEDADASADARAGDVRAGGAGAVTDIGAAANGTSAAAAPDAGTTADDGAAAGNGTDGGPADGDGNGAGAAADDGPTGFRIVASGNVLFASADVRLAADDVEFRTEDQRAVFHAASGSIDLGDEVERSMFGTQEADMLFYGERIERIGPRSYRITNGAFTSCVQPTPRWQLVSTTFTIDLDHYAFLRNAVIKVKDVPVFYLPVLYYPIQEDGRATGFLMPTFGASTYHGNSISNAFFWAMGRSQDTTFYHDWFREHGGRGLGAEYRYTRGGGSRGDLRVYHLDQPPTEIARAGGTRQRAGRQSYRIEGDARQRIGDAWTARTQVDYFSDITVQQTYNYNIYDASNSSRRLSGNLSGALGDYDLSGTYDFSETFFGATNSAVNGAGPRVAFSRGKTAIPGTSMYFSFETEYANLLRRSQQQRGDRLLETDNGLSRFDVNPILQIPFNRLSFLKIDSSVQWRGTRWGESLVDDEQAPVGIGRSFFELASRATGPSFVKIWDTPGSGYAERMKHVIEPWWGIRRVSAIDTFDRVVRLEGDDSIVGNVWQYRFGLDTRLYARVYEDGPGSESTAREILSASLTQSYYTDENAAQYDTSFRTSFNETPPTRFSPLSVVVRLNPSEALTATVRTEFDPVAARQAYIPLYRWGAMRTISAEGSFFYGGWLETRGGWSQRRFIEGLRGFDDPARLDHYLNSFTAVRNGSNTIGGVYAFNYDVQRARFLMQRVMVYLNAQCCGLSLEFQSFNFEGLGARVPVAGDRRINLSFTLAGLGTFANVLGPFGGSNF